MRCNGFTLPLVALLLIDICSNEHNMIEISTNGKRHRLKCDGYKGNKTGLFWRKFSRESEGKSFQDIFDGRKLLKNFSQIYELFENTSDLVIRRLTDKGAGIYQCPSNKIYLIVTDTNITCIETSSIGSNTLLHMINCSFFFKADESCNVTPLWFDQKTNKNITEDVMDHSSGYNDGYLWLRFDDSSDLRPIRRLGLAVIFDCSPNASSYYYDTHFIFDRLISNYFTGSKLFIIMLSVIPIPALLIVCFGIKRMFNKRRKQSAVVIKLTEAVIPESTLCDEDQNYEILDENKMVQHVYCNIKTY